MMLKASKDLADACACRHREGEAPLKNPRLSEACPMIPLFRPAASKSLVTAISNRPVDNRSSSATVDFRFELTRDFH
jgi:hypothetical protein